MLIAQTCNQEIYKPGLNAIIVVELFHIQYLSVKGKRGRGKGARNKPLTLTLSPAETLREHLFPKPN
ncbi:hypothetical protein FDUTEX481_09215 [Tolypothrix sp. PCC 7601]|nr:hypothetical protein FDUTEX481_09215 [Tolypothrix sp. PCC 7601]